MSGNYGEACDGLVPMRNNFLNPTAKLDDQKFEFYFLVDLSGSMSGRPYDLACKAILVRHSIFPPNYELCIFYFLFPALHNLKNNKFSVVLPVFA